MKPAYYFTTPIYYVNDTPHIGHAYTTVVADVLNRYQKLFGRESFFLTGTDEHGQKVESAAKKRGLDPQAHCDEMVENFKATWKELNIEPDIFMRTTFPYHKKAVQDCLQKLYDKGEIYSREYEGWYSVSEEIFYTQKDLVNGKSPLGNEVQVIKEKNYFFKMSKYQQRLIDYVQSNPKFIEPDFRRNETLGFLKKPLEDLCISRPKTRLTWGIELPFDRDYVTYVWFDALLNYTSAIGLGQQGKEEMFKKWWSCAVHLIGKDILTTHTVYWPTMLFALELPLPKKVFAHGWWLTAGNEKMSKSKGNVIKPLDVKNIIGVDAFRYFLIRDIRLGNDAQFSIETVLVRVNSELANNLGNLLSRTTSLVTKYFDGKTPVFSSKSENSRKIIELGSSVADKVQSSIDALAPDAAIGHIVELLTEANKCLEEQAPWKTAKTDLATAAESLRTALEVLRIAGILLHPVMPNKTTELLKIIGWLKSPSMVDAQKFDALETGSLVSKATPLFPRIENPTS